jgi:hypothetical protein
MHFKNDEALKMVYPLNNDELFNIYYWIFYEL